MHMSEFDFWVFFGGGLESDFTNGLPLTSMETGVKRLWRLELRPETIVNKTGN
jgi:hypothetical protein